MRSVPEAHEAVLATAKEMLRKGLVEGTSGNISARLPDGNVVCTPSSVDYQAMVLEDLVVVNPEGEVVSRAEGRSPTSELLLHLACYRAFDDIGSVIHAHPVWATMFACSHEPLPACVDEFTIYVGGEVRCAEYAMSGSSDVGDSAVKALRGPRGRPPRQPRHGCGRAEPFQGAPDRRHSRTHRPDRVGARALGGVVPIPEKVNSDFAGVYQLMRSL